MNGMLRTRVCSIAIDVGNPDVNFECIAKQIDIAKKENINLLVFPELCTIGKTSGDIIYYPDIARSIKQNLAKISSEITGNFACVIGTPVYMDNNIFDSAVLLFDRQIADVFPDNIDTPIFLADGTSVMLNICEAKDIFSTAAADINIFLGSSVACAGNNSIYPVLKEYSKIHSNAVIGAFGNVCESTTSFVTDTTLCILEDGEDLGSVNGILDKTVLVTSEIDTKLIKSLRQNKYFGQHLQIMLEPDNEILNRSIHKNPFLGGESTARSRMLNAFEIQTAALKQRLHSIDISKAVIGLSGGLDSLLALMVAIRAFDELNLNRKDIIAVIMPGFGSTNQTQNLAEKLADNAHVTKKIINISDAVNSHLSDIGHDTETADITFENAQARERTQILMDIANMEKAIVLGTGDMSEGALGFCTFNGDHMAMYNVNIGVPKTVIIEIVRSLFPNKQNEKLNLLPHELPLQLGLNVSEKFCQIAKQISALPPSPELLPASGKDRQDTQKQIGPYELNDFFMYYFLKHKLDCGHILFLAKSAFQDKYSMEQLKNQLDLFINRYFNSQFKRSCSPDGACVFDVFLQKNNIPSDISAARIFFE